METKERPKKQREVTAASSFILAMNDVADLKSRSIFLPLGGNTYLFFVSYTILSQWINQVSLGDLFVMTYTGNENICKRFTVKNIYIFYFFLNGGSVFFGHEHSFQPSPLGVNRAGTLSASFLWQTCLWREFRLELGT